MYLSSLTQVHLNCTDFPNAGIYSETYNLWAICICLVLIFLLLLIFWQSADNGTGIEEEIEIKHI